MIPVTSRDERGGSDLKIKAIMPDKAMEQATLREREKMLSSALSPDASICVDCIKAGPDELDCCTDEAFKCLLCNCGNILKTRNIRPMLF